MKRRDNYNKGRGQDSRKNATAPYNFVPLNDTVLENRVNNSFDEFIDLSGYIDLEMTAKSPIYVRGTLTEDDIKAKKEQSEGSFKPANYKFKIPGSSIRGMVRTLYEIITSSKMTFIDDKSLYFRSFGDKSIEFQKKYSDLMMGKEEDAFKPLVLAGYLVKENNEYFIYEAEGYHRVEERDLEGKIQNFIPMSFDGKAPNKYYTEKIKKTPFEEVYFKSDRPTVHNHSFNSKTNAYTKLYYSKIKEISATNKDGLTKGTLVLSGKIPKKHMQWVIGEMKKDVKYDVSETLIRDYGNDVNRKAVNLIECANSSKNPGVPCFFILDSSNKVKAFGHTGMFRLVYDKSIGDLRSNSHKANSVDMAESLFGIVSKENTIAGRVFFEDAVATQVEEDIKRIPKILSSPKPNSFQLYLEQKKGEIVGVGKKYKGIKNYDSDSAKLAGYKLYWHRNHDTKDYKWYEEDVDKLEKYDEPDTKIKALKEGSKFKARIRFENLKDYELGALLTVLDLPEGCCHKIGMAKPLGLGSIHIKPELNIINRKDRYQDFTSMGVEKIPTEKYTGIFAKIWDNPRLKELKTMLNYQKRPDNKDTAYMELNAFKERQILKKPSELERK
ncbi:MAG: TIGR03986 family CRISPR-associated RAMP protein [Candidatus Cloacimonadales bacterium]|jgi:CRISPR-associated protein (TIGR03986 family)|nr:TIGR03986 family CRISPR-associated RAMP protein [Candidatus Cloacimonadota bacterium]MDX9978104.1 TIGR03986 family CRISPR-associated RAMP protein [Candidatus Cloacimonadales bacterium]